MKAQKPVFLFAFANDNKRSLHLDEEWRQAERALQNAEDRGQLTFNLSPSVTAEELFEKFNRFHNQIAVFHYGGHSSRDTLHLMDMPLQDKSLATLLGQEKAIKLVFLNGCSNAEQVETLFKQGVPAVIATAVPIDDHRALTLSKQFYQALTAGRTIEQAFAVAAQYVNNRETKGLVAYRSLGKDKERNQHAFEWGLYVNEDRSVLNWSIAQGAEPISAASPAPPEPGNRWRPVLLGVLLVLSLGVLGWQFGGWAWSTPGSVRGESATLEVSLLGPEGHQDLAIGHAGVLSLRLAGQTYTAAINPEGEALFTGLPSVEGPKEARFSLHAAAYSLVDTATFNLQGISSLGLRVSPTPLLSSNTSKEKVEESKDDDASSQPRGRKKEQKRPKKNIPAAEEPSGENHSSSSIDHSSAPPTTSEEKQEPVLKMVKVRCRTRGKGGVKVWFYYEGEKYEQTSIAGKEDVVFEVPAKLTEEVKVATVYYRYKDYEDHRPEAFSIARPFEIPLSVRNRE